MKRSMLFVIAATVLTAVVLVPLGIEHTLQNGLEELAEERSVLQESGSSSSYSDTKASDASELSDSIEISTSAPKSTNSVSKAETSSAAQKNNSQPASAQPSAPKQETSSPPAVSKPSSSNSSTAQPVTPSPEPSRPSTSKPETSSTDSNNSSYVERVVALVNQERAKEGLSPLSINKSAEAAALVRAKETVTSFSHTRPNGSSFSTALAEQGVSYRTAGENIAWGQKTPEQVMQGWMNSPGHRANIMNPSFSSIGVGYYRSAAGTNYWTQLFIG